MTGKPVELKMYRPKFLLRWKFIYSDGSVKAGLWNNPGPKEDMPTKAWCNNKSNLKFAMIEAKNNDTRKTETVVECSGQDFQNFQWLALASVNPFSVKSPTTPRTRIGGLKMITRDEEITVFDDGTGNKEPNTKQNLHFATYGK